ncbi:MAG: arylesterase [Opitutales bacterium]
MPFARFLFAGRAARVACLLLMAIATPALPARAAPADPPTLLFLGDSLTAGYGIDPQQAFPALIREKIEADPDLGPWRVVPAGLSGETTAGGLRRIDWLLRRPVDVLVLALGANDGLRGIRPEATRKNLQALIEQVRADNPEARILLAGMRLPPNLGAAYTARFAAIFPELAETHPHVTLLPFLLEDVGGDPDLNLADGIHPNADGHAIIAETVWAHLRPLLVTVTTEAE